MSASNNTPGWPSNPDRHPYPITESGWYTFQHHFYSNGGVLAVEMTVRQASAIDDPAGATWTLSDPSDIIGSTVGGNRYGWLVKNELPLALDNITRSGIVVAPTPTCKTVYDEPGIVYGCGRQSRTQLRRTAPAERLPDRRLLRSGRFGDEC